MEHNHKNHNMNVQDYFGWRSHETSTGSYAGDEDVAAEVDEPPEHHSKVKQITPDFHKSIIRPQADRKESLLTRAFACTSVPSDKPDIILSADIHRRRSTLSVASGTSTVELTSDGGITSPARTDTPSPPFPATTYTSFASYTLDAKPSQLALPQVPKHHLNDSAVPQLHAADAPTRADGSVEVLLKKRCISFACGGQKPKTHPVASTATVPEKEAPKRTIKFACSAVKPAEVARAAEKTSSDECAKTNTHNSLRVAPVLQVRNHSRSPSSAKKLRALPVIKHRDSNSTIRRISKSPVALRNRRPTYIAADEESFTPSEATRFHEFASNEPQEDDWIRRDASETKEKLTINDTLKKENAIRRLGEEAEQEALLDEEEEDEDDDDALDESDDEIQDEHELDEDDEFDDQTIDGSDGNASDGNETDNEAGFADSDDESDGVGDFQFWTPGRSKADMPSLEPIPFRNSAHRTASDSSIDSLKHMSPIAIATRNGRKPRSNRIRIRPGTPDLPDSTDFVCGTLDEDRPLEDAYVSCMEARKREKRYTIPQDIDPSFPTSDPEDEEDNDDVEPGNESEDDVWLHGKFEDSDDSGRKGRRPGRKSPNLSPKRLHSPPPAKRLQSPPPPNRNRNRSPPPKGHFVGHSPRRLRSPPPVRLITSSPASPIVSRSAAITFEPLGRRPGLTHTKSLPRTPNAFCRAYRASRLVAANGNIADGSDFVDGHTRGAIDIVKGLEHKRQRRKEKHYQKHCNRARKGLQVDRRPLPGKGAERMRELGLQMAGKVESKVGKAEFVLSI